jgi:transcriptional regulator with XRE-family HTH domain
MSRRLSKATVKLAYMPAQSLAARVQLAMDAAKMSPADLARASQSTTATISNWRNGNVDPDHVKASQLFRIADALQVDGRWLLLGSFGPAKVNESSLGYEESHPLKRDVFTIAIQLVTEELDKRGMTLPPPKKAEAMELAYDLLEEGLPQAKVLRFVLAAVA